MTNKTTGPSFTLPAFTGKALSPKQPVFSGSSDSVAPGTDTDHVEIRQPQQPWQMAYEEWNNQPITLYRGMGGGALGVDMGGIGGGPMQTIDEDRIGVFWSCSFKYAQSYAQTGPVYAFKTTVDEIDRGHFYNSGAGLDMGLFNPPPKNRIHKLTDKERTRLNSRREEILLEDSVTIKKRILGLSFLTYDKTVPVPLRRAMWRWIKHVETALQKSKAVPPSVTNDYEKRRNELGLKTPSP